MTVSTTIAVVDDDESIRAGVSSLLRSAGHRVALFDGGEALLAALATLEPDCVITDIQMPGMSGLELQQVLARERAATPVVVMTAFPEPMLRERALAAGAICFLSKPFDAQALLDCVCQALDARARPA